MTHTLSGAARGALIATLAMTLAACGSDGRSRIASIGSTAAEDGAGGTAGSSGSDTGSAANGGGSAGSGTGSAGTSGMSGTSGMLGGPLLVTAGNTVIGVSDRHAGLADTINGKLPASGPLTGKVTAVLRRSGQTLVDLGNGRSVVLNKAGGAVGQLVSIDVGSGRVVGGSAGSSLIGVSALTPTQLASAAVNKPGAASGAIGQVATIATPATTPGAGSVGGIAPGVVPATTALPATPVGTVVGKVVKLGGKR